MNTIGLIAFTCSTALCFALVASFGMATWSEYDLQRVVDLNDTTGKIVDFNIRSKRFNKTVYIISGEITINSEKFNEYEIEILYFFSSRGNNQYTLLPFKIARKSFCDFLNSDYRKYFMEDLKETSNLPYSTGNEDFCPQFKEDTYRIDSFMLSKEIIPTTFDKGLYKGVLLIYNGETVSSGIEVYMKLY